MKLLGADPDISIHALREEGDGGHHLHSKDRGISIHALREEGDPAHDNAKINISDFYPRPP